MIRPLVRQASPLVRFTAITLLGLACGSPLRAVEIGDQVRIREGGGYRTGTVVGTTGTWFNVEFDDGRQPASSLLEARQFVSDEEIEKEQRMDRIGRFYQRIGGALAYATAGGLIFVLWWRGRSRRRVG